jgi:hypothetical protein
MDMKYVTEKRRTCRDTKLNGDWRTIIRFLGRMLGFLSQNKNEKKKMNNCPFKLLHNK